MSAAELALWRGAMGDVRPLRGGDRPTTASPPATAGQPSSPDAPALAEKPTARPAPALGSTRRREPAPPPTLDLGAAPGLDKRTLTRLKRGLITPEAMIDLHHLTQAEAHRQLDQFLMVTQGAGRRCVLVVTGKGYGSQAPVGVLKMMVPRWLNEAPSRERVLAFCHAAGQHGGDGALYVLLRRRRERQ